MALHMWHSFKVYMNSVLMQSLYVFVLSFVEMSFDDKKMSQKRRQ